MRIVILSRENAGRSQMAYGFFLREIEHRKLTGVEVVAGGTEPADRINSAVRKVMREASIDLMGHKPRSIEEDELATADYVITIGFEIEDVAVEDFDAETVQWDVPRIDEMSLSDVEDVRDSIEEKVGAFLDEYVK